LVCFGAVPYRREMPHGSLLEITSHHHPHSGWLHEASGPLASTPLSRAARPIHGEHNGTYVAPLATSGGFSISASTRSSFNSFLTGSNMPDGIFSHEGGTQRGGSPIVEYSGVGSEDMGGEPSPQEEMDLAEEMTAQLRDPGFSPDDDNMGHDDFIGDAPPPTLEEEGPGADMPDVAPRPKASPMLGHDMPDVAPRPKVGTSAHSASLEYWSVNDPHGNGTQMVRSVTDGVGHASVSHTHHESTGHAHHDEESHHDGAARAKPKHGGGPAPTRHRVQPPPRPPPPPPPQHADEDRREDRSGARDQEQDDQDRHDHNDQDRYGRDPRDDDQDRADGRDDDKEGPPPRAVIIISDPRDKGMNPVAVTGGLIAIFAQAYLWGNVFTTLFKPSARRSVDGSATAPVEVTAGQGAPQAQNIAQDATTNAAGAPQPQTATPVSRFSGASGQAGARLNSAMAR